MFTESVARGCIIHLLFGFRFLHTTFGSSLDLGVQELDSLMISLRVQSTTLPSILAFFHFQSIACFQPPLQPDNKMSNAEGSSSSLLTREHHELYMQRLQLQPTTVASPTFSALAYITEAHVGHVPFENLSQHGALGFPQTLAIQQTADKILRRHRGGFCFELNGLLAEWLVYLGYQVKRVPADVYTKDGFRGTPTHLILLVTTASEGTEWFVDVGFGEPPLHPLNYVAFGATQTTPEGMESRFVSCPDDDSNAILEWSTPNGWRPRLKWKKADAVQGKPLHEFQANLELVQVPTSIFAMKMITCLIHRDEKRTLSGTKYKITRPRFGVASKATVNHLSSDQEVHGVLADDFGIPKEETEGLTTARSDNADAALFSEL